MVPLPFIENEVNITHKVLEMDTALLSAEAAVLSMERAALIKQVHQHRLARSDVAVNVETRRDGQRRFGPLHRLKVLLDHSGAFSVESVHHQKRFDLAVVAIDIGQPIVAEQLRLNIGQFLANCPLMGIVLNVSRSHLGLVQLEWRQ